MADEARDRLNAADVSRRAFEAEQAEAAMKQTDANAGWERAVQECIPEFLRSARELRVAPDRWTLLGPQWLVQVVFSASPRMEYANAEEERGAERKYVNVAVWWTGAWRRVAVRRIAGTTPRVVVERETLDLRVDTHYTPTAENIRGCFVNRLSRVGTWVP